MAKTREAKPKEDLSVEHYFLRYAYPCSFILEELGFITPQKREIIEYKLVHQEPVSRDEIEKTFVAAFKRLRSMADEMKKSYWDRAVIKEYFFGEKHNDFINAGDGMYATLGPAIRDLCKIHKAEVIEKKGNILTVKYNCVTRKVFATLLPLAQPGDRVTVHWAFAIEKIE